MHQAVAFVLVAALWGATNPWIKRNSLKGTPFSRQLLHLPFLIPFLLNLCGSVVYYLTLRDADISIAVPVVNSLTFLFTTLMGAWVLKEPVGGFETWVGVALISTGVALCVSGDK